MSAPDNTRPQRAPAELLQLQLAKARFRARVAVWLAVALGLVLAALLLLVWWALANPLGEYGRVVPAGF
jgi:hypothetical protein